MQILHTRYQVLKEIPHTCDSVELPCCCTWLKSSPPPIASIATARSSRHQHLLKLHDVRMRQIPVIHNLPPHVFRYLLPLSMYFNAYRCPVPRSLMSFVYPYDPVPSKESFTGSYPLVVIARSPSVASISRRDATLVRALPSRRLSPRSGRSPHPSASIAGLCRSRGSDRSIDRWRNIDRSSSVSTR